jgi:hypothetical protein
MAKLNTGKVSGKAHNYTKSEGFMRCKVGKDGNLYIMSSVKNNNVTTQKWLPIGKLSAEQSGQIEYYDTLREMSSFEFLTKYRR